MALKALELAAAAADAAAKSKEIANVLKAAAQQSNELTEEQSAQLDAKAEEVFASPASQPSGR